MPDDNVEFYPVTVSQEFGVIVNMNTPLNAGAAVDLLNAGGDIY